MPRGRLCPPVPRGRLCSPDTEDQPKRCRNAARLMGRDRSTVRAPTRHCRQYQVTRVASDIAAKNRRWERRGWLAGPPTVAAIGESTAVHPPSEVPCRRLCPPLTPFQPMWPRRRTTRRRRGLWNRQNRGMWTRAAIRTPGTVRPAELWRNLWRPAVKLRRSTVPAVANWRATTRGAPDQVFGRTAFVPRACAQTASLRYVTLCDNVVYSASDYLCVTLSGDLSGNRVKGNGEG